MKDPAGVSGLLRDLYKSVHHGRGVRPVFARIWRRFTSFSEVLELSVVRDINGACASHWTASSTS